MSSKYIVNNNKRNGEKFQVLANIIYVYILLSMMAIFIWMEITKFPRNKFF